jgi:hypothetical protein
MFSNLSRFSASGFATDDHYSIGTDHFDLEGKERARVYYLSVRKKITV